MVALLLQMILEMSPVSGGYGVVECSARKPMATFWESDLLLIPVNLKTRPYNHRRDFNIHGRPRHYTNSNG